MCVNLTWCLFVGSMFCLLYISKKVSTLYWAEASLSFIYMCILPPVRMPSPSEHLTRHALPQQPRRYRQLPVVGTPLKQKRMHSTATTARARVIYINKGPHADQPPKRACVWPGDGREQGPEGNQLTRSPSRHRGQTHRRRLHSAIRSPPPHVRPGLTVAAPRVGFAEGRPNTPWGPAPHPRRPR